MPSLSHQLPSAAATRPLRVLVVDDDQLQLRAIEREHRGDNELEVTVVANAIDAMLAIGATPPDLIIMDIFMPGVDGLEACRRIKANPEMRDMQIVLTSSAITPELAQAALEAGATFATSKPIDVEALVEELAARSGTLVDDHPPAAQTVRAADLIVATLEEAGVEYVFGIPGGAISPIHDALLDSPIHPITTRHESGAMFAAAGYARATGRLAAVAVTTGPGILNSMTGLATAHCDGTPLLLLVGEVPRPSHGKGVLQDGSAHGLRVLEMVRPISKLALEVPRPSALPHLLRRAIATALAGRRGPVVLTLPLDVTMADVAPPRRGGQVSQCTVIEPELIDEIGALMLAARRPLILAGSGMRGDGAPERLVALVNRLSCPVVTTPKGKGVFPEDHPLALGVLGLGGHRSAKRYLESGVDLLLALGTSLGDLATDGFSPHVQAPALIQVDVDLQQIGRNYAPTHAVIAPAAEFLDALAANLARRPTRPRAVRGGTGGIVRHELPASAKPDRIAAHEAIAQIQELLPRDTIYTVDSGEHFVFATHFLELTRPDSYLVMTGLGSMGPSIGAAIGVQLAHRDRCVAAICGDGCFSMNAFEVATAVAERLPIRVFVFNDERLGMVELGHQTIYGRRPEYSTRPLDVCALAQGLGAATLRINHAGQLRSVRDTLLHTRGPLIIDVRIDREIVLPRVDRVAAMIPEAVAATFLEAAAN
jgi:acetolactate synthase-1/2/3 large subunit